MVPLSHNKAKYIRSLKLGKSRQERGEFLVEGLRGVETALSARCHIRWVVCTERFAGSRRGSNLLQAASGRGIESYVADEQLMARLSDTQTPQGVLAVASIPQGELDLAERSKESLVIVAHRIQDPGNLGNLIRLAHAAGASCLAVTKGSADPFSPKVVRSAASSVLSIPVYRVGIGHIVDKLKASGHQVVATHVRDGLNYYDLRYKRRVAFIVGNEAEGLGGNLLAKADEVVKIPMVGGAESLNVAVAAGIIAYEILRQRRLRSQ